MIRALAMLSIVSSCAHEGSRPSSIEGPTIGEAVASEALDGAEGASNGTLPPPAKMELRGHPAVALVGRWSTDTFGSETVLDLTGDGRFVYTFTGCTGTLWWRGDARLDGDVLLLVPDHADGLFTGGRMLDVRTTDGETELVQRPRSPDDRSYQFPLTKH